jgi:hypothetical protein
MSDKLKERAAQLISTQFEITEGTFIALFEKGYIDVTAVRNDMIRQEAKCICHSHTKEEAIDILSNRYSCSDSLVRQIIYNSPSIKK